MLPAWRSSFSICCKADLVVLNSPNFLRSYLAANYEKNGQRLSCSGKGDGNQSPSTEEWVLKTVALTVSPVFFRTGSDGKESACNAGELGLIPEWGRSPGGGHGNPLQHPRLENPMDGGAWRVTVYGVTRAGYNWAQMLAHEVTASEVHSSWVSGCAEHRTPGGMSLLSSTCSSIPGTKHTMAGKVSCFSKMPL